MTRPTATRWRSLLSSRLPSHALHSAGPDVRARAQGLARQLPAQMALAWLLLALVLAPTLGRLHQVVHGGALDGIHAGQLLPGTAALPAVAAPQAAQAVAAAETHAAADAATAHHGHGHGTLLLSQLLLAHDAPADCLLLDQLVLGAALVSASLVLPPAIPAALQLLPPAVPVAAPPPAPYQARAPPAGALHESLRLL